MDEWDFKIEILVIQLLSKVNNLVEKNKSSVMTRVFDTQLFPFSDLLGIGDLDIRDCSPTLGPGDISSLPGSPCSCCSDSQA